MGNQGRRLCQRQQKERLQQQSAERRAAGLTSRGVPNTAGTDAIGRLITAADASTESHEALGQQLVAISRAHDSLGVGMCT